MNKVPIIIKEFSGIDRANEPVTLGVPLPRGNVKKGDPLTLINSSGEAVPLQATPLAYWPDQSVRWMLFDFQASVRAREVSRYQLGIGTGSMDAAEGISVEQDDNGLKINTNVTSYYLDDKIFLPFSRVISDDIDVVDGSLSKVALIDGEGNKYEPVIEELSVEIPGSLRTTIKIEGFFQRKNRRLARFVSRLHFFAGKSFVKIDFTLWNPQPARHTGGLWDLGDPGSIFFKDLSLHIALNSEDKQSTIRYYLREDPVPMDYQKEHENYELSAKSYELNGRSHLLIYQDSSGGENWQSSNHVNRNGEVPLRFKGYQVKDGERVITQGSRANPLVYIGDGTRGISCAIQDFWQNYPKALQADRNSIRIHLFPEFFQDLHELQGGERKTHTILIDFGGEPEALKCIQNPLVPAVSPGWYSKANAIPYLTVNSSYGDEFFDTLTQIPVRGENTFFHRREIIDEFGWRNFGDVYADHEAVGHVGESPLIAHYNNQYDLIYGFLRQYIRKSDPLWYELMDDLARHVVDIDIYHTSHDRDEYNGGMFWHTDHYLDVATCTHRSSSKDHLKFRNPKFCGGGPGLEHNYTTGLLFHYYLTGSVTSKEAVLGLAEWVLRNIEGPNTILGTLYAFKDKLPRWRKVLSGRKVLPEKYPFTRGSGNSINTFLDAYNLTGHKRYLRKSEKIIRGSIHPKDDIESRDLFDTELRWSYTVFLEAVGKYLHIKLEIDETDDMYRYALTSLLHYATWMLDHEYPYLEKPEILEYPNETWPALELKKCNIFCYAARYTTGAFSRSFMEKARFFYNNSVRELNSFETKTLTRPITLLLQSGDMYHYFIGKLHEISVEATDEYDFKHPKHSKWLSLSQILKQAGSDLAKAMWRSSLKKEIKWLKTRLGQYF